MKTNLLRGLLLAATLLVGANAWADNPIETVNESFATGYRTAYSSAYTIASGETLNIEFINYNNGTTTQWNNYILEATSAVGVHDAVYFDMRADNFAFNVGNFGKTYSGNFFSDLDGATVNFAISYSSETGIIEVNGVVTTTAHAVYPLNYNYTIEAKPDNVVIYLTEESAKLEIMKADIVETGNITGLPFYTAFTNVTTPFDNNGKLVTSCEAIGSVFAVEGPKNGSKTSTAFFDTDASSDGNQPYTIGNKETIALSYDAYNGYYNYKMATTFAIVNSEDVVLASCTYNPNSQNYTDVTIGGSTVEGFEAFNGRSRYSTTKGVNGYTSQPYSLTTGYNPIVNFSLSGNGKIEVSITGGYNNNDKYYTASISETMDLAKIVVTNAMLENRDNNSDRIPGFDNLLISSTTVAKTTYTVQFHDDKGNELADDVEYDTYVGNAFTASDEDLARIFYNSEGSIKYANPTGNTTQYAVEDASSNVITLVFTSYAKMNFTLNAVEKDKTSNILATSLASGYVYADSPSATINIPWYVVNGGTLYNQSSNQTTKTVESNNQVFTVEYVATETTGVVYYAEAETMNGRTRTITNSIASNRGTGTFDNATYFTTLPRGKYYFYVREHSGNSSGATLTVKAGDTTVGTKAFPGSMNNQTFTSDEFSIYTSTDLTIQYPGGNATGIDYIYIVKTADIPEHITATTGEAGWISFSSAYNVTVPEGMRAYTATISGDAVTATKITESVIPANTGVLLRANSGEYTLTVETDATALSEDNELVATGVDGMDVDASVYFGLAIVDATNKQVGFAPISAGKVGANKAILPANAAVKGRALPLVVDGQATGIWFVGNDAVSTDGPAYNLAGQRVADNYKGIVIRNGKKFLVK